MHCSITPIALGLIAGSAVLFILAGWDGLQPADVGRDSWLNETIHQLSHFETLPNGTRYYNWTNEETGELEYKEATWAFDRFWAGYFRYFFGSTWDNFCWPRNDTEYVPNTFSIFRIFQLRPYSQSLIRTVVLGTMGFRIFATLFVVIGRLREENTFGMRALSYLAMFLTVTECLASFALTDLQIWQDKQLAQLLHPCAIAFFTIVPTRMMVMFQIINSRLVAERRVLCWPVALCLSCVFLVLSSAHPLYEDMVAYELYPYCDIYTGGKQMLAWASLIVGMFAWTVHEALATSSFHILIVPLPRDFEWDAGSTVYQPAWSLNRKPEKLPKF
ncbi:unnamed protein product, partial [Mesorhabditis spiculigera]